MWLPRHQANAEADGCILLFHGPRQKMNEQGLRQLVAANFRHEARRRRILARSPLAAGQLPRGFWLRPPVLRVLSGAGSGGDASVHNLNLHLNLNPALAERLRARLRLRLINCRPLMRAAANANLPPRPDVPQKRQQDDAQHRAGDHRP